MSTGAIRVLEEELTHRYRIAGSGELRGIHRLVIEEGSKNDEVARP